jgi:general secretion pathway protein A
MTIAPHIPFAGSAYQEIQAALARALMRRDGLVVLIGETGVGKTTLWNAFVEETGAAASAIVNPFLDFPDLLAQVTADLGLALAPAAQNAPSATSEHEQIRAIQAFVEKAGRPVILIVDDAHLISRPVLNQIRALINLSTHVGGLTVLLAGQPPLETALRRREFRTIDERIVHRWHLGPLTRAEVPAYVAHCFADLQAPPADVLESLAELSEGIPAVINRIIDAAVIADPQSGCRQLDAEAVLEAAAVVRAEAISARRRAVVSTVGVALASAGLAVTWLGASPWRPGIAPRSTIEAPITDGTPSAPTTTAASSALFDGSDADVRLRLLQRASGLAAQGDVTALLRLRAAIIERARLMETPFVTALLVDVDGKIAAARLERLRLDGEILRRQSER